MDGWDMCIDRIHGYNEWDGMDGIGWDGMECMDGWIRWMDAGT